MVIQCNLSKLRYLFDDLVYTKYNFRVTKVVHSSIFRTHTPPEKLTYVYQDFSINARSIFILEKFSKSMLGSELPSYFDTSFNEDIFRRTKVATLCTENAHYNFQL